MRLSNKLLGQGYVKERLKSSLRKFYGRYGDLTKQYEAPLSRMLHDILDDDHIQWHPPLIGHYTNFWPLLIWTLLPNLTFYLIVQGFHRTYATGAACQQRTLTPPDTWSCPFGICKCSFVETTDTRSYIRPPIHDSCPDLTFYRIRLLSLIWTPFLDLTSPIHDPFPSWPLTEFDITNEGLHGACATGVACRQGTLTPPDTWSCPTSGLACVLMSRPISPELVLSPDFWISNTPRYFSFAYCCFVEYLLGLVLHMHEYGKQIWTNICFFLTLENHFLIFETHFQILKNNSKY